MAGDLIQLRNIGAVSVEMLAEIGIYTRADLERVGVVAAYRQVKALYPRHASLNLLYSLAGALADMDWRTLPEDYKAELRAEAQGAK